MAALDYSSYRRELLTYVGAPYLWGGSSHNGTDCSGILRAIFRLPFTANDFYERIFTNTTGHIGAVFLLNNIGIAYHVMPIIQDNIVLDANVHTGTTQLRVMKTKTGHRRYI